MAYHHIRDARVIELAHATEDWLDAGEAAAAWAAYRAELEEAAEHEEEAGLAAAAAAAAAPSRPSAARRRLADFDARLLVQSHPRWSA